MDYARLHLSQSKVRLAKFSPTGWHRDQTDFTLGPHVSSFENVHQRFLLKPGLGRKLDKNAIVIGFLVGDETCSITSVLSGRQTGSTVDEGAVGKESIATDENAPKRSSFYTVPDRMMAGLSSPTLLTCDEWNGWGSEGVCSPPNDDTRCNTDTGQSPLSHGSESRW
ncbi:hypothetical protein NPIL_319181 [Nephila pilipes]|uniref:Uncharacterized protein n=1 Tax=Nephila pilipes TaxID=299642 RepID=A0A8X6PWA9_NEPPI|nr:hypothetical protein NPIL_646771 [Nephila pilipes]GFT93067.1 hypothetical protein NPIL_319181 [Nephila pilipes]